jgi:hypothetical protein
VVESKPYAGRNGEQVESTQSGLNYLAGGADDELREITQRTVEYRPVESIKRPKHRRGALAATGTLVALSMTACSFAILLKKGRVICPIKIQDRYRDRTRDQTLHSQVCCGERTVRVIPEQRVSLEPNGTMKALISIEGIPRRAHRKGIDMEVTGVRFE